jgi:hypothetical protein
MTTTDSMLSVPTVARLLGRTPWWVVQRIKMGELEAGSYVTESGRTVRRIPRAAFDAWVRQHPNLLIERIP